MGTLADILAKAPVPREILAAAAGRRPPHATLLEVEDPSVGRDLAERWLAALQCPQAPDLGTACGECPDCAQVAGGSHPGFVPLEPDGAFLTVDQVRGEVLGRVGQKVPGGRYQVFLLPRAECLNQESGNTLLKVVEEPPPRTLFFMVTPDREQVLGTIRSRAQVLRMPLPSPGALFEDLGLARPAAAARAALAAAGFAPRVVEGLAGLGPVGEVAGSLGQLVEDGPEAVRAADEAQVLRDLRPIAQSAPGAEAWFRAGLEAVTPLSDPLARARLAHALIDGCSAAAVARADEVVKARREAHGPGWSHPSLARPAQFGRALAGRVATDLLRAMTAALAMAMRARAGVDPDGMAAAYPALGALAGRPRARLLAWARRIRQARVPLMANQNARLCFEELFTDLAEAGLGGGA